MREILKLACTALLVSPTFALNRGTLGFALGTKKSDGTCKYTSDYESDFNAIKSNTGSTLVRGYSASDCNCAQQILPAAKSRGFQVVLGVWPDTDESFTADKEALSKYATKYPDQVYAVTVGSETLYRGNFTGPQLLSKINDVKAILPNTKVGTADSWNKYADGTADAVIRGGVDILMANAFSYWQGKEVGSGAEFTYFDDWDTFNRLPDLWIASSSGTVRLDGQLTEGPTTEVLRRVRRTRQRFIRKVCAG